MNSSLQKLRAVNSTEIAGDSNTELDPITYYNIEVSNLLKSEPKY